jgi:cytosine/adenosine deaminase-related metal-dependent hydrolase
MKSSAIILSGARCFIEGKFQTSSLKLVDGLVSEIAPMIAATSNDIVLHMEGTVVLPGLINAHDHLEFDLFKKIGSPPYQNYVAWGEDIHNHHKAYIQEVMQVPLRFRLLWGAYKNIFSGVTTVAHHNKFYFRFRWDFPLEVLKNYSWIHSLELDGQLRNKLKSLNGRPCIIHLAEGVDELARTELSKLIELGGLTSKTVLVHGIGLTRDDYGRIEEAGASLVWCPSSNEFLFHRTASVEHAFDRIRMALGTDSTLTGNPSLFDEIRCALESKHLDGMHLLSMVTSVPADMFGIDKGTIGEGHEANLLLYDCGDGDPINGFLSLDASKIKCLLRKGVPLYGDTSVVESFRVWSRSYSSLTVAKKKKMIRGDLPRLVRQIQRHLPSFDFNGLPIELDPTD